MNRRSFMASVGAGVGTWAASGTAWSAPAASAGQRPKNFVIILIDDLGWADLGCYGSTFYETPNLDRLAKEGVRFTNAYAAAPVCSPTRASIMTGKVPARTGITNFLPGKHPLPHSRLIGVECVQKLPLSEITLAEALKTRGYATSHVGKWHLGPKGFWPEDQGFDSNVGGTGSGSPRSYFYPKWGDNPPVSGKPGDYLTDRLTDFAVEAIRTHQQHPFFLYFAHHAVHIPVEAKQELVAKYKAKLKPGQPQNDPAYAAMVQSMDESVGRVMSELERLKLKDDTLVLFTSDNGGLSAPEWKKTPVTSNAPLREGKGFLYEGGVRVPLIAWGGGAGRGLTCDAAMSSIDFYPTLLNQAGAAIPEPESRDGVDITSLIQSGGTAPERTLYWHYPHYSNQGGKPSSSIRRGNFKLIEFHEDGHAELYDLREDLSEKKDLAAAMPEKTAELRKALREWRASVKAEMPTVNSEYDPARAELGYAWNR